MNISDSIVLETKKHLEANNFEVFLVKDAVEAKVIFVQEILEKIKPKSISYADSITLRATGTLDAVKMQSDTFIDTFNPNETWAEQVAKRKEALTVDMFLTGTNAVTEKGQLVNLDMVGNRVAPISFGPRNVVLFISTKKIVKDLEAAFKRVKEIAAPLNAQRHENFKTPCQKTGICSDCKSPQRICNTWTITEKSYPKARIKIILIEEDLGL